MKYKNDIIAVIIVLGFLGLISFYYLNLTHKKISKHWISYLAAFLKTLASLAVNLTLTPLIV